MLGEVVNHFDQELFNHSCFERGSCYFVVVKVSFNPLDEVEPRFLVPWSQKVELFFVRHVTMLFFAISQRFHDLFSRWVEVSSQFCLEAGSQVCLLNVASESYSNVSVFQAHCEGLVDNHLDFITIFIVTVKVVFRKGDAA